jgi:hypothetical protein
MELEVVRIVMGLHTFVANIDQFCKHPLAVVLLDFVGFCLSWVANTNASPL